MSDGVSSIFTPETTVERPPRPWLAALLSAAAPGSGQLYAGRVARAIVISTIAVAAPVLALLAVTALDTAAERLAVLVLAVLLLAIGAAVDAWHVSQTPPHGRPLFRRWYAIAAYIAVVLFVLRPPISAATKRLVQIYTVEGVAMSLTLQSGDHVVATPPARLHPRMVVVWRTPEGAHMTHRIVGMPGDRLEMRNFRLLVNRLDIEGEAMRPVRWVASGADEFAWQREHLADGTPPEEYRPGYGDWGPLRVPAGHYFVLGDNRYGSRDSRHMGFIRRDQIVARVRWVFYSSDVKTREVRFARIGHDVE